MNKEGSRVICNLVPTSFQAHRVTYDSRPFLVHLVFASLHPSLFHEMIFTLVYYIACKQPGKLYIPRCVRFCIFHVLYTSFSSVATPSPWPHAVTIYTTIWVCNTELLSHCMCSIRFSSTLSASPFGISS